jgi:hypothetical protein
MPTKETIQLLGSLTLYNKLNSRYLTSVSLVKAKEKDQYDKLVKNMKLF